MFDESADWGDGGDLDVSLREALLSKPVATPTKKSRNKYRPESVGKKRKQKIVEKEEEEGTVAAAKGKRKRTKREPGSKRVKHAKTCVSVFDELEGWEEIIANHEAEDQSGENLGQYFKSAAEEITKENDPGLENLPKKKKKKKKVQFESDDQKLLSQSMTGGAGTALSSLSLDAEEEDSVTGSTATTSTIQSAKEKITKLKGKFQKKMDASQFRYINEKLYTCSAEEAAALFEKKPELFDVYHRGFTAQVQKWEVNPVDRIIELIRSRGDAVSVADFGCGDAKIAQSVTNPVYSFDLVQTNEHVIVANSNKVPLGNKSVDIAVFCLSLMGTDFKDFIREARRVLKSKGTLVIAEVSSRIPSITDFVAGVEELGFKTLQKEEPNSFFTEMIFKKIKPKENKGLFETLELKPCTYKKR